MRKQLCTKLTIGHNSYGYYASCVSTTAGDLYFRCNGQLHVSSPTYFTTAAQLADMAHSYGYLVEGFEYAAEEDRQKEAPSLTSILRRVNEIREDLLALIGKEEEK